MRRLSFFVVTMLLAGAHAAHASEDDWRAERLWVVGGDRHAWVVGNSGSQDGGLTQVRMWHVGPLRSGAEVADAMPEPSRYLKPVNGNPQFVGADSQAMRVLYSQGAVYNYFPKRSSGLGTLWRHQCSETPLAWAGDATRPIFWALVRSDGLVEPVSSQPTSAGADETVPATTKPDNNLNNPDATDDLAGQPTDDEVVSRPALTLLRLHNGHWRRLPVLSDAEAGRAFWLAGRGGTAFLFWREDDGQIRCADLDGEDWSSPETVSQETSLDAAWAGADEKGPVFVAGRDDNEGRVQLDVFLRDADDWKSIGTAHEGDDYLKINPTTDSVAICRGRLAVARVTADGKVEFGSGDLYTSSLVQFASLSMRTETSKPVANWQDFLATALVLGLLTMVLFTRREQLNRPAVLPSGCVIAPTWKRIFATLVDYLPAVLVAVPWFMAIESELGLPADSAEYWEVVLSDPEVQRELLPLQIASLLAYGLWCLTWELATGTTLGKRMFGCRVLSVDGAAATGRQIALRNLLRVITFGLGPPGMTMTLMLMILFTRNRQRMGDLIAGTIVVQRDDNPSPIVARPLDPDEPPKSDE